MKPRICKALTAYGLLCRLAVACPFFTLRLALRFLWELDVQNLKIESLRYFLACHSMLGCSDDLELCWEFSDRGVHNAGVIKTDRCGVTAVGQPVPYEGCAGIGSGLWTTSEPVPWRSHILPLQTLKGERPGHRPRASVHRDMGRTAHAPVRQSPMGRWYRK